MIDYEIPGPVFTRDDARVINLHRVEITDRDGAVAVGVAFHVPDRRYLMVMPNGWTPEDGIDEPVRTERARAVFLADIAAVRFLPAFLGGGA